MGVLTSSDEPPALGTRRLAAVRPSEIQFWTGRAEVMSPLRLRNLVSMVRAMYADAALTTSSASTRPHESRCHLSINPAWCH
jgi:hypothetical protein